MALGQDASEVVRRRLQSFLPGQQKTQEEARKALQAAEKFRLLAVRRREACRGRSCRWGVAGGEGRGGGGRGGREELLRRARRLETKAGGLHRRLVPLREAGTDPGGGVRNGGHRPQMAVHGILWPILGPKWIEMLLLGSSQPGTSLLRCSLELFSII